MAYRVILSSIAEEELESSFLHILYEFTNPTAAEAFLKDAQRTVETLSQMADSFPLCDDVELGELGCRIIHFKKYRYKMVYRISGRDVEVDGVYHNLQDLKTNYLRDRLGE